MKANSFTKGLTLTVALALVVPMLTAAPSRAAAGAAAGPGSQQPLHHEVPTATYGTSFEKTLQPWTAGTNDHSMTATLTRGEGDNGCDDGGKAYGLLQSYAADPKGKQPDNPRVPFPVTTWLEAPFAAPLGPVDVTVDWSVRDLALCVGCQPAVYVGTQSAASDGAFRFAGAGLTKQWQHLRYQTTILYGNAGTVFVALGWFGSGASIGIDCVTVKVSAHYDYNFGFENNAELAAWEVVTFADGRGRLQTEAGDAGCDPKEWAQHGSLTNAEDVENRQNNSQRAPQIPARLMQAAFPPTADQFSDVTVTMMALDEQECAGCTPLIYIGTTPLTQPTQMVRMTGNFTSQWQSFKYSATLGTWGAARIYVAIGWQDPAGGPTRLRSVGYDCLNIHIEPSDILP